MPDNPSRKRRELAAQCLALAEQISDVNVRAKLVAMAQKWLDLANDEFGSHELDAWNKTFYHRAIQTKIREEHRAQYEPPPELPDRDFRASDAGSR
jgi:hypothetical protein